MLIPENVDCPADANRDGIVDIDDLIQVFLDWTGEDPCEVTDACLGDVGYDCRVDDADLDVVRSR